MTQPTLFELDREPPHAPLAPLPRSRKSGPATSAAAAQSVAAVANTHREMVLDLVFRQPGLTTHELADLSVKVHGEDYLTDRQINKRLPELKEQGRVEAPEEKHRKCKCKSPRCAHYKAQVWYPKD